MKKEIHLRLIKRIFLLSLLAVIAAVGAGMYAEYRRLDTTLLADAVRESTAFHVFLAEYQLRPTEESLAALREKLAIGLHNTSFLLAELLSPAGELLVAEALPAGPAIDDLFRRKNMLLLPGDRPDSVRLLANKRLYLQTMIPLFASGSGAIDGYVRGIYQLSLEGMQNLFSRFLLTAALTAAAALFCGGLIYFGILALNSHLIRSAGDLSRSNTFLLKSLGSALAKSDVADAAHSQRVVIYATRLAEKISMSRLEIRGLLQGCFLHDLGMLPVDFAILHKADWLNDEQRVLVNAHPTGAVQLIRNYRWLHPAEAVVAGHHEKYDGSGYPAGLAREKIPLAARVFAIADAFDSLSTQRPYRDLLPLEDALRVLEQQSGSQFDPVLLSAFVELAPQLFARVAAMNDRQRDAEVDRFLKKYLKR